MTIRIGEGWDGGHLTVAGRKLIIGGVEIPHSVGLWGHSDADVLLHAITDALLGAAALGDIGKTSRYQCRFQRRRSGCCCSAQGNCLQTEGYRIGNIDSTVIAQAPKLAPYIDAMRARIAAALNVDVADVNVKAKTAEKMGPVGEGKSMEARAVVSLTA